MVRLLVGVVGFSVIVSLVDTSRIVEGFAHIRVGWVVAAIAVHLAGDFVWAIRWKLVLRAFGVAAPIGRLYQALFVGLFFNQFLPSSVAGDLYRSYWVLDDKRDVSAAMLAAVVDRFIGLGSLGMVTLPGLAILVLSDSIPATSKLLLSVLVVGVCTSVFLLHPTSARLLVGLVHRVVRSRLDRLTGTFLASMERLYAGGRKLLAIYFYSVGVQISGILLFLTLGQALSLPLQSWHYLVLVPVTVLAVMIPISINGLGLREGALASLAPILSPLMTPADGVVLGLAVFMVHLLVSLAGGLIYLVSSPPEMRDRRALVEQPSGER